jgi:hypothetical protein
VRFANYLLQLPVGCSLHASLLFCRVSLINLAPKAEALLQEQASWPTANALQKFGLYLQRYTTRMKLFSKKWIPRFFVLSNGRLYFSDGSNGHPDSKEGTLSFVRSDPAPGTRHCVDLRGTFAPSSMFPS